MTARWARVWWVGSTAYIGERFVRVPFHSDEAVPLCRQHARRVRVLVPVDGKLQAKVGYELQDQQCAPLFIRGGWPAICHHCLVDREPPPDATPEVFDEHSQRPRWWS